MDALYQTAYLANDPFAEAPAAKEARLLDELNALTMRHATNCIEYRRILDAAFSGRTNFDSLVDLPYLPVRLFKETELVSVPQDEIVKTLTSSGTTGQIPSRIMLDKNTAAAQARALVRIMRSYLGNKRLPMLILDCPEVLKGRTAHSARGAGIIGFSQFGSDHTYALKDETMEADWPTISAFLEKHQKEKILLFGFTFMIWQYLLRNAEKAGYNIDFGDSILIHGGGWKKLADQQVSNDEFKERLRKTLGIREIYNYYGMVEQTGSIYLECESGYFHPADYSEIIIRDPRNMKEQEVGKAGLIETISTIPWSYPGHVLLTEDLGVVHGLDGCDCSRRGRYFSILGRLTNAELRGCSDTHGGAL
jgi:acyl-CoA synthetase (AMP-forming)/AMP-acid ligase II